MQSVHGVFTNSRHMHSLNRWIIVRFASNNALVSAHQNCVSFFFVPRIFRYMEKTKLTYSFERRRPKQQRRKVAGRTSEFYTFGWWRSWCPWIATFWNLRIIKIRFHLLKNLSIMIISISKKRQNQYSPFSTPLQKCLTLSAALSHPFTDNHISQILLLLAYNSNS